MTRLGTSHMMGMRIGAALLVAGTAGCNGQPTDGTVTPIQTLLDAVATGVSNGIASLVEAAVLVFFI